MVKKIWASKTATIKVTLDKNAIRGKVQNLRLFAAEALVVVLSRNSLPLSGN